MSTRALIVTLALLAAPVTVMAQDSGGLAIAPQFLGSGAIKGLARPLPFTRTFVTAHDVQNGMTAADHQAQNQAAITKLRGDPGLLSGFSFGAPLAASRQAPVQADNGDYGYYRRHHGHDDSPIIINNEGPLAITNGNGNVVQQQSSNGALGAVGQQQVATTPMAGSGSSGATNLVTAGGNIIQRAPH